MTVAVPAGIILENVFGGQPGAPVIPPPITTYLKGIRSSPSYCWPAVFASKDFNWARSAFSRV